MPSLLCYAMQEWHTGLRQKKLVRRGNSNLYHDKRQPFFKVQVKLGHPGSSCLRPACHACQTVTNTIKEVMA
jgi:hypothetical protein